MTLPQDIPPDIGKLQSEMNAAVKAHWKAFLFEGIVLALLGLAAMIVPPLASLAVAIFLGWMFLISGIAGLFATWSARIFWPKASSPVRAGAPPRIVGTLVLAADLGRDGPADRVHHRFRAAGFGGMGDRPPGRDQSRARRCIAGRHGARRAPILTPIMG